VINSAQHRSDEHAQRARIGSKEKKETAAKSQRAALMSDQ